MDGLSSDDDEVQFTGTLDADAARERDRAAAEASGNAFDLCSQESTPAQGEDTEAGYMAYFAGRHGSTAAAEPDTDGEDASPFVDGGGEKFAPWIRVAGPKRYLCHPFSKNDEVKREVGARFDGSRRQWYIPEECLCARNLEYCRSRGWLA